MKNILISILGGVILGMTIQMNHVTVSVDDIVRPHYNKFISIAKECKETVNEAELRVEIDYNHPNDPYYAVAYRLTNLVSINFRKYMWLSSIEQEQVILHELGHALLDLSHDDDDLNLMNSLGFIDEQDYKDNYDYYIRKLFDGCEKQGKFVYGQ